MLWKSSHSKSAPLSVLASWHSHKWRFQLYIVAAISHFNLFREVVLKESQFLADIRNSCFSIFEQIACHFWNIGLWVFRLLTWVPVKDLLRLSFIEHVARSYSIYALFAFFYGQDVVKVFVEDEHLIQFRHLFQPVPVQLACLREISGFERLSF